MRFITCIPSTFRDAMKESMSFFYIPTRGEILYTPLGVYGRF